jgi:hypothetical protein
MVIDKQLIAGVGDGWWRILLALDAGDASQLSRRTR